MKPKLFFGVFVVFVLACLFFFFFFGVARANGQQKRVSTNVVGARDYNYYDGYTNIVPSVSSVAYYKDKVQLSYVSEVGGDKYAKVVQDGYQTEGYGYTVNYEVPAYHDYYSANGDYDARYAQVEYKVDGYRDVTGADMPQWV